MVVNLMLGKLRKLGKVVFHCKYKNIVDFC